MHNESHLLNDKSTAQGNIFLLLQKTLLNNNIETKMAKNAMFSYVFSFILIVYAGRIGKNKRNVHFIM